MWPFPTEKSPYLKHPQRLPEILAAIQVMGAHRIDSLRLEQWEERLGKKPGSADSWKDLFEDHPEFFQRRLKDNRERWVLTWRLAYDSVYDHMEGKEYNLTYAREHETDGKFSRKPLNTDEIAALLKAAIELQTRATAFEERQRWLITAAISFITAVAIAVLTSALKTEVHPSKETSMTDTSLRASPTPSLQTSPTPSLQASPTPSLQTSPTPSLQTSPTPSLQTSPTPSLRASPTPSLQASPTSSLQASPTPSVQASNKVTVCSPQFVTTL
jgi:hypothetical protein